MFDDHNKLALEVALSWEMRFVSERVRMFREATTRPNIGYSIAVFEGDGGDGATARRQKRTRDGKGQAPGELQMEERVDEMTRTGRRW